MSGDTFPPVYSHTHPEAHSSTAPLVREALLQMARRILNMLLRRAIREDLDTVDAWCPPDSGQDARYVEEARVKDNKVRLSVLQVRVHS